MDNIQILPTAELSPEDAARFDALQAKLVPLWQTIGRTDPGGAIQEPNTLVVVPSLTADIALPGAFHQVYEERFLFMLFLLRQPNLRMIYLTSQPVPDAVVEYYLHLLPDVIISNARKRLMMVSSEDGTPRALVHKLLSRPQLLATVRGLLGDPDRAHLVPFLTTNLERELTMQLGIPMYAADPRTFAFGSKSGGRRLLAEEGIAHALGYRDLSSEADLAGALQTLRAAKPDVRRAIVKLNEGVSGIGNTVVDLRDLPAPGDPAEAAAVLARLRAMQFETDMLSYEAYIQAAAHQGAVVEEMLDGEVKLSPSVQMRVSPLGELQVLSTHDQMLGGPSGQSYLGAIFPADPAYSRLITTEAIKVGRRLAREGVVGRFAVDFLVVRDGDADWQAYAIEINLRKGGTTHPFLSLQYLTDGLYDPETGVFRTELGGEKCYIASDHIESEAYRQLTTDDLFDLVTTHRLHYDHTCQTGVILHMFSKVAETARLGVTAIHNSPALARALYDQFIAVLDEAAAARGR
jgi:hypothetical protein